MLCFEFLKLSLVICQIFLTIEVRHKPISAFIVRDVILPGLFPCLRSCGRQVLMLQLIDHFLEKCNFLCVLPVSLIPDTLLTELDQFIALSLRKVM